MKIVVVTSVFPPSIGGVQTHVYELARAMAAKGHQVRVISKSDGQIFNSEEFLEKVRIQWIGSSNLRYLYYYQLNKFLKKLIAKKECDVIHVHGMRPLKACVNQGVPIIFTNHTSSFLKHLQTGGRHLQRLRQVLQGVDKVLAPSTELVDATLQVGYEGPTEYIPNGVDVNKFYPAKSELRKQLGIPDSAFVIILARRLVDKNGTLYMAEAMKNIQHSDIHLIVAGDGEQKQQFENIINKGHHPKNVHMLGFVLNSEMTPVYQAGDICVLPSLMEATSITGLEAMATGLPLIGTRVGGIPDLIDEGNTGLLIEPRSPEQIQNAVEQLYRQRELTDKMKTQSVERAHKNFTWETIAARTVQAYEV